MPDDVMLQEAVEAIRQGQRVRARDLLTRLLRTNQSNPEYWLWMSSVVDTTKEQIYCLQSVLRIDPTNNNAKKGLVLLGALAPDAEITPAPLVRRQWEVKLQEIPKRSLWANPIVRAIAFVFLTILIVGLIVYGAIKLGSKPPPPVAQYPTNTPGPSPTFTYTPTSINFTPRPSAPTPTYVGPRPLWMDLVATYTPTPFYAQTPHVNEAYIIAQRAYQRGELESALANFKQIVQGEPSAVDILFYIGEIYRQQGNFELALETFEQAITADPTFAPAYVGKALTLQAIDPKSDIEEILNTAIDQAPEYGEAYLELANYFISTEKTENALENLAIAEELLPSSPLLYLYRARLELVLGESEAALEDARRANELDKTLLPGYELLGITAVLNEEYDEAIEALEIYLTYEEGNADAWLTLGQALYATEQFSDTISALDHALQLNSDMNKAALYRGLAYLELGEGQLAVNDLLLAQRRDSQSFFVNLALGRAFLAAGRLNDAREQITYASRFVMTDAEQAQIHYWLAITLEAIGNRPAAIREWQALLKLPEESVPTEWLEMADARLTATPTITPSPTTTGTPVPTKSTSATVSPTATKTSATSTP